jgi:putative flippase GtrA
MPLASSSMSNPDRTGLVRLIEDHGMKVLRYCGVSVVNVIIGAGTFLICLAVFDLPPLPSNLIAWAVSTGPAYLLSRYWVWEQSGASSVKAEIAPFWILALVGLTFSSICVTIAGTLTDSEVVLLGVQLVAYGIVWIAKYLVLDQLMWSHKSSDELTTEVV